MGGGGGEGGRVHYTASFWTQCRAWWGNEGHLRPGAARAAQAHQTGGLAGADCAGPTTAGPHCHCSRQVGAGCAAGPARLSTRLSESFESFDACPSWVFALQVDPAYLLPNPHSFECLFGFATRPGAEALLNDASRNSFFTSALLQRMKEFGHTDTFGDLMRRVWEDVTAATSGLPRQPTQKPCCESLGLCNKRLLERGESLLVGPSREVVDSLVRVFEDQVSASCFLFVHCLSSR